jgi:hypothetical protein
MPARGGTCTLLSTSGGHRPRMSTDTPRTGEAGSQPPSPTSKVARAARETTAAAFWLYASVKVFVLDIDVRLAERFAPQLRWVLDVKFFILIAVVALLWLLLGNRRFVPLAAYVVCYPLILLFWRLPLAAFHRWPIVLVFAPAIYRTVVTFRSAFMLYTLALLSALGATYGAGRGILTASMFGLGVFLLGHLYRAFRKAYSAGLIADLASLARKIRKSVEDGIFDSAATSTSPSPPDQVGIASIANDPLPGFYILPCLAEALGHRIARVATGRRYDLYLVGSWLYTVAITISVFSFEYLALHRMSPAAFASAEHASFWSFFGLSLGLLTTSNVSPIRPSSALAAGLCYAEIAGSVLMLVILAFAILTAGREAFRQDVEEFSTELRLIGTAFESRALALFQLTIDQMEYELVEKHEEMVKWLRKARGKSELPPPRPGKAVVVPGDIAR